MPTIIKCRVCGDVYDNYEGLIAHLYKHIEDIVKDPVIDAETHSFDGTAWTFPSKLEAIKHFKGIEFVEWLIQHGRLKIENSTH